MTCKDAFIGTTTSKKPYSHVLQGSLAASPKSKSTAVSSVSVAAFPVSGSSAGSKSSCKYLYADDECCRVVHVRGVYMVCVSLEILCKLTETN